MTDSDFTYHVNLHPRDFEVIRKSPHFIPAPQPPATNTFDQNDDVEDLLERARTYVMTPEEKEAQRQSFVYGNIHMHNPRVTREMVADASQRLAAERQVKSPPLQSLGSTPHSTECV